MQAQAQIFAHLKNEPGQSEKSPWPPHCTPDRFSGLMLMNPMRALWDPAHTAEPETLTCLLMPTLNMGLTIPWTGTPG